MSPPKIENRVSLGNFIQIGVMIVAIAAAFFTTQASTESNAQRITRQEALSEALELRIRIVEQSSARADERLSSIYTLLTRIDGRLERIERGEPPK